MAGVRPSAFLFWYKSSEYAPTEYIYIIACSYAQARFYFFKAGYGHMYDYCYNAIDYITSEYWLARHAIGDILGTNAII